MSSSDNEKLDIPKKEESGSDTEEGSDSGSDGGGDDDAEAVAGGVEGDDDEEAEASDIDESEGEGEGEGEGEEGGEAPSFASGVTKIASASKKLLSNIQDVVSNAGKNVGAIAGSGDDLLSKLTKSSVKMPSGRGRKKRSVTANAASTSLFEEDQDPEEDGGGDGNNSDGEDDINTKLKKFDKELRDNYLMNFHPESLVQNYDEIYNLARVVRDDNCIIVDALHRTLPMLTKYEKSRILGQRAKQINDGATPFVKVPEGVIDGYLIAIKELEEKKIPFIIRRPLPNGGSEYWHLEDLEIIN